MRYTLVFDKKSPATKLIQDKVLGIFNDFNPTVFIALSLVRYNLKTRGIPGIYVYNEIYIKQNKFKIKNIYET